MNKLSCFKFNTTSIHDAYELTFCDSNHRTIVITNNVNHLLEIHLEHNCQHSSGISCWKGCKQIGYVNSGNTTEYYTDLYDSDLSLFIRLNDKKYEIYGEKIKNHDSQLTVTEDF